MHIKSRRRKQGLIWFNLLLISSGTCCVTFLIHREVLLVSAVLKTCMDYNLYFTCPMSSSMTALVLVHRLGRRSPAVTILSYAHYLTFGCCPSCFGECWCVCACVFTVYIGMKRKAICWSYKQEFTGGLMWHGLSPYIISLIVIKADSDVSLTDTSLWKDLIFPLG